MNKLSKNKLTVAEKIFRKNTYNTNENRGLII
jgi:hypothetical protein